jgi:hypothetical protein
MAYFESLDMNRTRRKREHGILSGVLRVREVEGGVSGI